jgi:hypothetical protein
MCAAEEAIFTDVAILTGGMFGAWKIVSDFDVFPSKDGSFLDSFGICCVFLFRWQNQFLDFFS